MSLLNFNLDKLGGSVDGDQLYQGYVVDVNDPLKIGRVRVRVPQFFPVEVIDNSSCPWAVMKRHGWGGSTTSSTFTVPELNSRVLVQFLGGDIYSPVYETCPVDTSTKISDFETNYPYRYGWKDPDGSYFVVDTKSNTVDYVHVSGFEIHVREGKTVDLIFPQDKIESVSQDETHNVGRDQVVDIQRDQKLTITRNLDQTVGGNLTILATGNVSVTGSTVSLIPSVGASGLKLGSSSPTDFIVLLQALLDLRTYINSHTHSGVTTGSGNSGSPTSSLSAFTSGTHYTTVAKAS